MKKIHLKNIKEVTPTQTEIKAMNIATKSGICNLNDKKKIENILKL